MINNNSKTELKELMNNRRNIYQLLSRLFQTEIDEALLNGLKTITLPVGLDGSLLSEYNSAFERYNEYFANDFDESIDDLAVDYATTFLGAGIAQGASAFPYESVYTSVKKIMMQEAWSEVIQIYKDNGIQRHDNHNDLMEDHISIELGFMAYLCEETAEYTDMLSGLEKQKEFINRHLLNWVPTFCLDIKQYADTEFYRMIGQLTSAFLQLDSVIIDQMIVASKSRKIPTESFTVKTDKMNSIIGELKKEYRVYGPAFITDNTTLETDSVVRYQEIEKLEDIVLDRQSTFSIKETVYPVLQTLLTFDQEETTAVTNKDTKGIIIFARPCDVNGLRRLDNIFLANGGIVDPYYKLMREKIRIFVLQCNETFDNCFCVSTNSNITDNYSVGCKISKDNVKIAVTDSEFLPYFAGEESSDYQVEFITENKNAISLPNIDSTETLNKVHKFSMWDEMSEDCISCGGCNTVCPTCSCYDTVDYLNQENSSKGKRCRVWSSCMLPDFSKTAGGHVARPLPSQMMRFKTLHKVYDYNKRFGGEEHMCVGCGRCIINCPKDISFSSIVNRLADSLDALNQSK